MLENIIPEFNSFPEEILFWFFAGTVIVQLFYWLFFYLRVFFFKSDGKSVELPVSVVICAKNEAENLRKNLPLILNQKYKDFEVIVVNDCSDDDSEFILHEFIDKYENLYVTQIYKDQKFSHGKKLALTLGIKAAKNEILLLTDADCYPISENWISSTVSNYDENTQVILAYGGYENRKGFLNTIIRFETVYIAMQYFTFAKSGIPYMGTGRNLSYKKSRWIEKKGFESHSHILSGDDDLFVNAATNRKNTKCAFSKDSFTKSVPKTNFKTYFRQKKRHLTTGKKYKFEHKLLLGSEIFSRLFMYISLIILLSLNINLYHVLAIFGLRFLIQQIIFIKTAHRFNEKNISIFIIIFDILIPIIHLSVILSNLFTRKKRSWR